MVLTGFWAKDAKSPLRGLAFNNIFTTAQLNRQLNRKLSAYKSYDTLASEAEKGAQELEDRRLPGGLLEMALESKDDSVLVRDSQLSSNIVAFAIGHFEEVSPDTALNEMSEEDFEKVLAEHPDQKMVQKLSDEDRRRPSQ